MQVTIEKIVYTGKSLAHINGKVVLTDEGLPGEIVEVEPVQEKKNYIEAKTTGIIKISDKRVTPRCSHYKSCSPYQYIDYAYQLEIKEAQLREILVHDLKTDFKDIIVRPSSGIWGYRNKIRLKVLWKSGVPHLAYHVPQTTNEFTEIDECFLASPEMNHLFAATLKTLVEKKALFVDEIEIKESFSEKSFLTILHSASHKKPLIIGKDFIEEKVSGKLFQFGAQSFFQVNVSMLEELVKDIKASVPLTGKETIADLYCGVGTLGILLSENAGKVIGVESERENISFLKKNLLINNVGNFDVREGYCEKLIQDILKQKVDLILVDPPRKGLDEAVCKNIIKHNVRFIAYVSCNPSTLTRDLKILLKKYRLSRIWLYDFFPHTTHIEVCVLLEG
ncbi:MAG: class I SAM-dependent RNA methyltransferase [Candidatus Omnitrophica bacterium]|nr:class I SAM-dependent RNA methyltransferase [Candidatus Omnitrophota bacterium]